MARGGVGRVVNGVCAGLLGAALLTLAPSAGAFCRTTTCVPGQDECTRDEKGCILDGLPLFWTDDCVTFSMQEDGSLVRRINAETAQSVTEAAFANWLGARCGAGTPAIGVLPFPQVSCGMPEYNYDPPAPNANVVMFRDDVWPYIGANNVIALTTITFDTRSGQIFDADIEVNSLGSELTVTDDPAQVKTDLQSVLTHEIGHLFGLAHNVNDPGSSMYPRYNPADLSFRTPNVDDQMGMCAIRPADPTFDGDACPAGTQPRHGFGTVCSSSFDIQTGCGVARPGTTARQPWVLLLGLTLGLSVALRRRR